MSPVTIINTFSIKSDKIDEFVSAQQSFAAQVRKQPCGLLGGRLYRSVDGTAAVLISQFESQQAFEEIRQREDFKQHLQRLAAMVNSANPARFEEAYTTGNFS
jgi:quinol monooxygenase YgiN